MVAIYARSDLMSVTLSPDSGGCGQVHSRPVIGGAPAKIWRFTDSDCPVCAPVLKKDAQWGNDQLHIPQTPDEVEMTERLEKEGRMVQESVSKALATNALQVMQAAQGSAMAAVDQQSEREELRAQLAESRSTIARLEQMVSKMMDDQLTVPAVPAEDVVPQAVEAITKRVTANMQACPQCGGPLRKPGARGPAPKVCADCRK